MRAGGSSCLLQNALPNAIRRMAFGAQSVEQWMVVGGCPIVGLDSCSGGNAFWAVMAVSGAGFRKKTMRIGRFSMCGPKHGVEGEVFRPEELETVFCLLDGDFRR